MTQPAIKIKYYPTTSLEGLKVSSTEYHQYHFPKHFHKHYTILLVAEGVNEGFTEKNKYKISMGGLIIINPGDLHAGNSLHDQYLKFYSLRMEETFLRKFCQANETAKRGDIYFNTRPIYQNCYAQTVKDIITNIKSGNSQRMEENLTELLLLLLNKESSHPNALSKNKNNPSIDLARQFIHDHYDENFTLEDLSKAVFLSPFHLIRQFKKELGLTPFQYLRNLRVEKAKKFLTKGKISRIASEVGFFDHSHFLKSFKKIEGVPPSRFSEK